MNASAVRGAQALPAAPRLQLSFTLRALAAAAASFPLLAAAEEPPSAVELAPVVVQASALGRTADELVQPVTVLADEELQRKRRGTLGETLENEPGIATTDFGAGAGRPVIRGQAGPRVEVLQNGLSTMDVSELSPDHAVTIDPAHAQQVEVLKGPATLLYGNGASGGVVNVRDARLPEEVTEGLHGGFDTSWGSNGDTGAFSGEAGYGSGKHQLRADFGWREAGDYDLAGPANVDGSGPRRRLPNSDVEARSGGASYSWIEDSRTLGLAVSRFESQYGLPVEESAFIDMHQTRIDAQGIFRNPLPGLESLKLRLGSSEYEHTEFEEPGVAGTRFDNRQYQGRLEAVHVPLAGFRGVAGLQINWRDFQAIGEEAYVPPVLSRQAGLFIVEERPWRLGKLEIGARVDRNTNDPQGLPSRDFTPLSFSLGSVFNLGEHAHLKLYATSSERSPAPEELYADGPHAATATYERGNADAGKERAQNLELGYDYHRERWTLQASVYYNRVSEFLYLSESDQDADGVADRVDEEGVLDPAGEFLLVDYRQADAKFWGYEASAGYALLDQGPLRLDLRLFTDQVRGELDGGGNLPRVTPQRWGLGLDGRWQQFAASLDYIRVDRQDRIASLETETAGYDLLNASLSWRVQGDEQHGTTLYLRGSNLLDEDIRRATSFIKDAVPAPGRGIYAGLRFSL
ncbi:TonB-dependent receptor [Solimonas fluminis]|uniref:TonB-dependent receptor n=1 Tax=Solimonas fluminis TaxID=2086571 RepID=A0A2S5TLR8_9GAMM|nr:TonB-dependent receptor [Solimonas fluminis]PPE75940.1 TonB-dependent receptor [Solimonas fluminis]